MSQRSDDEGNSAGPVLSLVELCYRVLTSGSCEWQQLEDLPPYLLLHLLKRCAEERREFEVRDGARGARLHELEEKAQRRYKVDPPRSSRSPGQQDSPEQPAQQQAAAHTQRIAQLQQLLQDVRSKWQTQPVEGLSIEDRFSYPSYPIHLLWVPDERRFTLVDNPYMGDFGNDFSSVISSAMLLYRACCLFPVDVNTTDHTDRYKRVWELRLWHAATGRALMLTEHKAAAGVHVQWPDVEDPQLSSDFLQLMDLLCGDCPHPYDWTLAGSVAEGGPEGGADVAP